MQSQYFELALRELHGHPMVRGLVMWTGPSPEGCYRICLVDNNFRNLPAGKVVDKLLSEWRLSKLSGMTDQNGFFEANLFHGDYAIEVSHPVMKNYTFTQRLQVTPTDDSKETKQFVQLSMK